ncbi:MAG: hypothetical protein V3T24_10030 [Longimicrobiales bacterium]
MSWWTQVWHVAKKDVRQFRWLLALQVLATVMAVTAAVDPGSHGSSAGLARTISVGLNNVGGAYMMLVALAILISGLVVQADSPSRSDAFWASRPLHPLAVLTAKGATLGLFLLGIPLVAEAVVLWDHAVPPGEIAPMLAEALVAQGGIVVAAATVAALTANLSAFFMLFVGIGVVLAGIVDMFPNGFQTLAPVEIFAPAAVLGVAVLAYQYSSRNLRRSVIGLTLASVAGLAVLGWTSGGYANLSEMPVTASPDVVRTDLQWGSFEVEAVTPRDGGDPQTWTLWTTVRLADPDPRFDYVLVGATARLHMADGTVTQRRIGRIELSPYGQRPGDFEWLFEASDDGTAVARIEAARLSWVEVQSVMADGAWLEFDGRVEALAAEEWGSLPLTAGAELTGESSRFRVLSVRPPGGSGPFLRFFGETIHSYLDIPEGGTRGYTRYALVNRELGEGLVVPVESRANRHAMIFAGGSVAGAARFDLDVPWVFNEEGRERAVDETWTEGAELMIMPSVSVGGYPIVAEVEDVRIKLVRDRQSRLRLN